jgi:hypothetical protein
LSPARIFKSADMQEPMLPGAIAGSVWLLALHGDGD